MQRFILILLFVCSMLSLPAGLKRITGGFRIAKIQLDFPFYPEWETGSEATPEIRAILEQPFQYLDRGTQCYVFESLDKKYVIKLFRYDKRQNVFRLFYRTLFPKSKEKTDFQWKIIHLFEACKIAYERVADETGLVFIHLNPTPLNLPVLVCQDVLGRKYRLPLDQYRFVLQKKAGRFFETLKKAHQCVDPSEMQKYIDAIFSLLDRRTAMNISNSDPNLDRNFGFLDGKAIEIDFGNYNNCPDFSSSHHRFMEINRYIKLLRCWLEQDAPEWVAYLDKRMQTETQ